MQSLRRLMPKSFIAVLTAFLLPAFSLTAGELTCATWNMEWFPSGIAFRRAAPDIESARIGKAAKVIDKASPSVLFVQEIRDKESCDALCKELSAKKYKVATCSNFKDYAGIPYFQQCAIFSSYPILEAFSEDWHSYGVVDPPRGYAFALLDIEGGAVACYCLHLKSNLTRKETDNQLNILKRELAATQLLRHVDKMSKRTDIKISRFIVAGDFNTNLDDDRFLSEGSLRELIESGFRNSFEGMKKEDRVTIPASGPYPDTTFDYILTKGFDKIGSVKIIPAAEVSDHRMVVSEIAP